MNYRQSIKRILSFTLPHIHFLILSLICAIISVVAVLYIPIIIGDAIDYIISEGNVDFAKIKYYCIILIITVIIYGIFQWIMSLCTTTVAHKTIKDIRIKAYQKIQKAPLSYIDSSSQGDLIARMVNDVEQISTGLLQGFTQLFTGIIMIIGTIIFMVQMSWPLAIIVVVVTPLSLFVASFIAKRTHKMFKETSKVNGKLSGHIEEMVSNQKIVKTFNYENKSIERFKTINQELYQCGFKAQFYSALTNPSTRFVNSLVYAIVGVVGAIFVINDSANSVVNPFTVGGLFAFLSYANQYTKPFNEISGVVSELQTAMASANRIFAVIDAPLENDIIEASELKNPRGLVDINHLYFSYTKDKKLIEDFNLHVSSGQKIAIVGPTGCGKTTIINLLMRFYDPTSGTIEVDKTDIQTIQRASLRKVYGMVLQETWVFTGTIRENITYANPNATEEEMIAAAKAAHIHNSIMQMNDGYDTIIDNNTALSAGQRQLLCIARVMLKLPPMLILDEATSSIDTLTEIKIQNAFAEMMKGRTSFIIAHRLSTIQNADVILVMKDGNIIEQGNHASLLAKHGFYYDLFNSQYQ